MATSGWLWLTAVDPVVADVLMSRTRAERLALERIGGRFSVEAAAFEAWFAGL